MNQQESGQDQPLKENGETKSKRSIGFTGDHVELVTYQPLNKSTDRDSPVFPSPASQLAHVSGQVLMLTALFRALFTEHSKTQQTKILTDAQEILTTLKQHKFDDSVFPQRLQHELINAATHLWEHMKKTQ